MAKETVTLFHNPRCSKSRAALELLRSRGVEPVIVEYLKVSPSVATLREVVDKLGIAPSKLVRTQEAVFREIGLESKLDDDEAVLSALNEHPILIERPIALCGSRARIGRPPEKVLELL
jgi:arsenate reductase